MKHFYQKLFGYFDFEVIYDDMVKCVSPGVGARFAEIGVLAGKSAAYMAVEIANSGKQIQFDCVDNWDQDFLKHGIPEHIVTYEEWDRNIKPVRHLITEFRMTSLQYASMLPDESLDFCFIDADHCFESVVNDIKAFKPKIKRGGYLAGHDLNQPGVFAAVRDQFTSVIMIGSSWIVRRGHIEGWILL